MKTLITTIAFIITISLSACTSMQTSNSDITFETKIDSKANFKGYNSYQWMGSATFVNDPLNQWSEPGFDINAEIKLLIDNELRSKGMTEAAQNPDVIIAYAIGLNMTNIEYKENPDKSFKTLEAAPKGKLAIMIVDAQTGVIIWGSTAKADIQNNTGDSTKGRLKYAITSMLGSLPK